MARVFASALIVASGLLFTGASRQAPAPRRILIEAERFNFTPSRVKLTVGYEVEFVLRSADTSHGFSVDDTDIDLEIPKRGKGDAVVRFTAATPGRFAFECDRMCGAGHAFMRGEIVVEEKK